MGHFDHQQHIAVFSRSEMALKLFLSSPKFIDHDHVLFLNVLIDPGPNATWLDPGPLRH